MKLRMCIGGVIGTALLLAIPLGAQDKKATDTSVSVTGCLAQGDQRNEYSLKDADGKTYGLRAGSEINLKAHLGHKVIISGNPIQEKKEKVKTGQPEESEHLRVNNLSMVSTTCP